MGWVVSSWRTERLAALLDAQAHEAAREIVLAAERDARRITRTSAREKADAAAYLEVLERLGVQTREAVRAQRRALRGGDDDARVERVQSVEPVEPPAHDLVPAGHESAGGEIRIARSSRPRRASLRDSPLSELFRATGPLPAGRALD